MESCEGADIVHVVDLPQEEGEGEKAAEETSDAEALESAGIGFQKRIRGSVDGVEEDRGVEDEVEEEEDKLQSPASLPAPSSPDCDGEHFSKVSYQKLRWQHVLEKTDPDQNECQHRHDMRSRTKKKHRNGHVPYIYEKNSNQSRHPVHGGDHKNSSISGKLEELGRKRGVCHLVFSSKS